jgi:short-subunit dehydrogenase
VHLGLLGRDRARLAEAEAACRRRGAEVTLGAIDVRDRERVGHWLEALDDASPIELLIANAGVMAGTAPGGEIEPPEASVRVVEVNVLGALNTLHPVIPRMMARRRGQIAIMSSIAGFCPLPDAPTYAASKAAMTSYGLGLRTALHTHGVKVSVICPGFVDTPMTAQIVGTKNGMMSMTHAIRPIIEGLERDRAVIAFPTGMTILTQIGGLLPDAIRRTTSSFFRFKFSGDASPG